MSLWPSSFSFYLFSILHVSLHVIRNVMMMKNIKALVWPLFMLSLLLTSCGVDEDRARFEGKITNINNAEFYLYSEEGAFDGVDTIRIKDGEFVYERKALEPMLATLLYPNYTQTHVILEPGKVIKMKGDASKLGEATITGSDQNELLTDFRLKHFNAQDKTTLIAAEEFVRSHAQTLAAVSVFRRYFTDRKQVHTQTALQLLDVLCEAQPKSRVIEYLDDFFRPIFVNGVGSKLPEFKVQTIDDKTVTNADYKDKNLVIACVGLWQNDSHKFMRQLKKEIDKAGKKWDCLIVSMDFDVKSLRTHIERDSLDYHVVCDQRAFESPIVRQLGLHYVPSCMVVNAEGTIVQRDVMKVEDAKIK